MGVYKGKECGNAVSVWPATESFVRETHRKVIVSASKIGCKSPYSDKKWTLRKMKKDTLGLNSEG